MDKTQSPPADLLLSKYHENNLVKKDECGGDGIDTFVKILDMNISIAKLNFVEMKIFSH